MPYNPANHHRRSIRLQGYDYHQPGHYFVTICTHGRVMLFGGLTDDAMLTNPAGKMILYWWNALPSKFANVVCDTFVVMPDHIHGIIVITLPNNHPPDPVSVGAHQRVRPSPDPCVGPSDQRVRPPDLCVGPSDQRVRPSDQRVRPSDPCVGPSEGRDVALPLQSLQSAGSNASLPHIMQWFKTMTTNAYIRGIKCGDFPPFDRRIWQRGYYERIIRDEIELENTRRYLLENPLTHSALLKE